MYGKTVHRELYGDDELVYINCICAKCLYLYSIEGFVDIQGTDFCLEWRLIVLRDGLSGTKTGS